MRPPINDAELETRLVALSEMVAVVPREHPLATQRRILSAVWGEAPPTTRIEEPDAERIIAAVASGAGISILDRTRARRLSRRGVLLRRFTEPVPVTQLALAWRPDSSTPALQDLLTMCTQPAR
ncbi:MAG: LysR substrate-binding domain-containing protein [Actinomycetota bacterium]|nr:LysR substrate-binding domain-containing protein [Actinomycetota bacterium]